MSNNNNNTTNNTNVKKTTTSNSLYVGDLHPDINEAFLFDLFRGIGTILSIKVCRDNVTSKSLGYAYVNFQKTEDADRAIDEMNYTTVKGQPIRIMWSQRDPSVRRSGVGNIFIKNLEKSIDNKALYDTFGIFGKILSCKVATRPIERIVNGKKEIIDESLGYGFVHFEKQKSAELAIQKVNGMMINNKKVFVGHHLKKQERDKDGNQKEVLFTNVYVNNLPKSFDNKDLQQLFEKYGEIISAVVEKDDIVENENSEEKKVSICKGFGFVCFKNPEDAKKACDEMNNKDIDGKKIYCGRAEKKSERIQKLRDEYKKKLDEYQKYQGLNLYFKNIDDVAYTEEELKNAFEEFGELSSFAIMKNDDEKKTSKGFGFVSYKNLENAQMAINKLHNKSIKEKAKPLYVSVAQRKETRRQQLEQQYLQRNNFNQMQNFNSNVFNQVPQNQFYNNIMRPRWTNQNNNNMNNVNQNKKKNITNTNQKNMNMNKNQNNNNQNKGFKFNQNVKNKELQNNNLNNSNNSNNSNLVSEESNNNDVLNTSVLARLDSTEVSQILGEKLYPLISQINQPYAGKITGMLLLMEVSEILLLIENPELLSIKVKQALEAIEKSKTMNNN